MPTDTNQNAVSAYTVENLQQLVEANDVGPELTETQAQRLVDVAENRTQSEQEHSMDDAPSIHLVTTTWDAFCRDKFGSSTISGHDIPNRYALVTPDYDVSEGRDALLCTNAVAVQQSWLETGDGRRAQTHPVDLTDGSYHNNVGEFWMPKSDSVLVIKLADELVRQPISIGDAM